MKKEVFKENERVFFTCPQCGADHTMPAYGMVAYEKRECKCLACKTTFNFYLNQIGKAFTEEENRVRYIGYIYKVL